MMESYAKLVVDKEELRIALNKIKTDFNNIIFCLPVSLNEPHSRGDKFFKVCENLNLLVKKTPILAERGRVSKIKIDVGDILNRHNLYYKYASEYMFKNNIESEKDISEIARTELKEKSYKIAKEQGREWFAENIDAINCLIPNGYKIFKDFKLNDDISVLYEGNENYPKIEYICYEHWLKNPQYHKIELALNEICSLENSIINRAFAKNAELYYNIALRKGFDIKYKDFFLEQSKIYLKEEAIVFIMYYKEDFNTIEFYPGRENYYSMAFKGKKVEKDESINSLLNLYGIFSEVKNRRHVTLKFSE